MDLAVKVRFFRHLLGGDDPDALEVYLWHIERRSGFRMDAGLVTDKWKKSTQDYLDSAQELFESMESEGFLIDNPIEIDRGRELLGGSHRLACALVLEHEWVPIVQYKDRKVWAPAWDFQWFVGAGMDHEILKRTTNDFIELLKL